MGKNGILYIHDHDFPRPPGSASSFGFRGVQMLTKLFFSMFPKGFDLEAKTGLLFKDGIFSKMAANSISEAVETDVSEFHSESDVLEIMVGKSEEVFREKENLF